MYIILEGGEGPGKGVQKKLLQQALEALGFKVLQIVEPGGTDVGLAIRTVLLNRLDLNPLPLTEVLLFFAARAQQVLEVTRPALEKGYIIISDRSFYSTYVYQGYVQGMSLRVLKFLTRLVMGKTNPDRVILLDIPPEIGLARKNKQEELNRLDMKSLAYHRKVRKGYLLLAKKEPKLWRVIDAEQSIEAIHAQILAIVLEDLKVEK